jgi:hypothetical protein
LSPDAQGRFKNIAIPGRGGSFMAADGTFYISDVNSARGGAQERPDHRRDHGRGRLHGLLSIRRPATYTPSTVATRPGVTKAAYGEPLSHRTRL